MNVAILLQVITYMAAVLNRLKVVYLAVILIVNVWIVRKKQKMINLFENVIDEDVLNSLSLEELKIINAMFGDE